MEPLTVQLSEEQLKKKQAQQRAKAPPPGTSRILSRATRDQKKQHMAMIKETSEQKKLNETLKAEEPKQQDHKETEDGWQSLIENLIPNNLDLCLKYMNDDTFTLKIKNKLQISKQLMIEAKIEGASQFRELSKLITNLLSIQIEIDEQDSLSSTLKQDNSSKKPDASQLEILQRFSSNIDLAKYFFDLLKLFLSDRANLKNLKEVKLFLKKILILKYFFFNLASLV